MRRLRTTAHRVPTSASLVMAALLGLVSPRIPATPAAAVPPYTVEERAATIANAPKASTHGREKSHSGSAKRYH